MVHKIIRDTCVSLFNDYVIMYVFDFGKINCTMRSIGADINSDLNRSETHDY